MVDVFENFRDSCIESYKLDPAHYYTLPGYTWDAMLKYTGVELDLLSDIDMLMFIERGIRGGISQCSNRYAKANNQHLKPENYNRDEEDKYIMYYDINNLYGWTMVQNLPHGGFKWEDHYEKFNDETYINNIKEDANEGFILEVDLGIKMKFMILKSSCHSVLNTEHHLVQNIKN